MYTDKKNALQLISLLKEHGINHIVFSPGTRNVPISHSIENDDYFMKYMITDERSAAFFALGLIQKLNRPVALSCTSGSAMMNYGPALSEAYIQNLPLLLITSDLPSRLLGQAEAQMIPQFGTFDNLLKKSFHIPEVRNEDDEWLANRLINEALLELNHHYTGPVQINIEFFGDLYHFTVPKLPQCRKIDRVSFFSDNWEKDAVDSIKNRKIMIILGQKINYVPKERKLLSEFVSQFNCIVITDYLSNFKHKNVIQHVSPIFKRISRMSLSDYFPDIIITLYGNYTFHWLIKDFFNKTKPQQHWHVSSRGELMDKFKCLTGVFEMPEMYFFEKLLSVHHEKNDDSFIQNWKKLYETYKEPCVGFSDLYVVGKFIEKIPKYSSLHIANSNSIRHIQLFELDESINILCNRGTDGIDGCVSTAVGYAALHDELTFLLIGDLAFFYDHNGLWNNYRKSNLRILLNNNHGAGLFAQTFGIPVSDFIGAHHDVDAGGKDFGFIYLSARNQAEFEQSLPLFLKKESDKPILFEVFSCIEENVRNIKYFYSDNSIYSKMGRIIPSGAKKIIKKFI